MTQSKVEVAAPGRKPRKRRANHVDLSVGQRLRQARLLAGASQEDVGTAIGVSFQAVQKYENGENRITAPRLFKAAEFLGADIRFFTTPGYDGAPALDRTSLADDEIELLRYYRALTNQRARMLLRKLVQAIGEPGVIADWPEQVDIEG